MLCGLSHVNSDYAAGAGAVMQGPRPEPSQGPAKRRKLLLISKHAEPQPAASNGSNSINTPEKDDSVRPKESKSTTPHPSPKKPSQTSKQSSAGLKPIYQKPKCNAESGTMLSDTYMLTWTGDSGTSADAAQAVHMCSVKHTVNRLC